MTLLLDTHIFLWLRHESEKLSQLALEACKDKLVLPENDANRQIANRFLLDLNLNDRAIQILPPATNDKGRHK